MIVDRYYYQQLNKQEQAIYKAFYQGVMKHKAIIPIPIKGTFSENDFRRIFLAMTRDNPLIYFLNQSACSLAKDGLGHIAICPQYFFSQEKIKAYNRKIEQVVNYLVKRLRLMQCDDYEKEIRVHNWICQNIQYDYEGTNKHKVSRVIASHNILGVFAYHKAQCEGIAKAVKVLLNTVDVKCIVVTGNAVKDGVYIPHTWNIVNIDGEPYQLDVTWDIGTDYQKYDYFNLKDEWIEQDHKADCVLPACSLSTANYYVKNKCIFQTEHSLLTYIHRLIVRNERIIEFRVEEQLNQPGLVKEVTDFILKSLNEQERNSMRIRAYVNKSLGIYRLEISR